MFWWVSVYSEVTLFLFILFGWNEFNWKSNGNELCATTIILRKYIPIECISMGSIENGMFKHSRFIYIFPININSFYIPCNSFSYFIDRRFPYFESRRFGGNEKKMRTTKKSNRNFIPNLFYFHRIIIEFNRNIWYNSHENRILIRNHIVSFNM